MDRASFNLVSQTVNSDGLSSSSYSEHIDIAYTVAFLLHISLGWFGASCPSDCSFFA